MRISKHGHGIGHGFLFPSVYITGFIFRLLHPSEIYSLQNILHKNEIDKERLIAVHVGTLCLSPWTCFCLFVAGLIKYVYILPIILWFKQHFMKWQLLCHANPYTISDEESEYLKSNRQVEISPMIDFFKTERALLMDKHSSFALGTILLVCFVCQ